MITVLQHNKNEWARMAQSAYANGRNDMGHAFSAAASVPARYQMPVQRFDYLQSLYRAWLVFGWQEVDLVLTKGPRLERGIA